MPKIICNGAQNKGFGADAVTTGMQIGGKKMPKYIDANALYEKATEWEVQALDHISKLNETPFEEMSAEEKSELVKWSAILAERIAFRVDIADKLTYRFVTDYGFCDKEERRTDDVSNC